MPEPDHDDRHDRGLLYDLAVLRRHGAVSPTPTLVGRRGALKLLGGAGAALVLVACGANSSDTSVSTTSSSSTTSGPTSTTAAATATTVDGGSVPTEVIPEETAGPFPGDGSNGPNVLTETGIVRQDIRSSFGDLQGTAEGAPLEVDLTIVNADDGSPYSGAAVYVWHCDRDGGYSLYSEGVTDQNYLRGVQEADDSGALSFTTIYPGAYSGRWPHIHFEVFPSVSDATSVGSRLVTSQIALPEDTSNEVYASDDGYSQSVSNMARSSLQSDTVFSDGYDLQLPTVSGDLSSGLTIALTVAV